MVRASAIPPEPIAARERTHDPALFCPARLLVPLATTKGKRAATHTGSASLVTRWRGRRPPATVQAVRCDRDAENTHI
jgi:hypothetical protein